MSVQDIGQATVQAFRHRVNVLIKPWLAVCSYCRQASRDRDGMTIVSATVLAIALRHESLHQLGAAAKGTQRKPTAHGLAQCTEIGSHTKVFLGPAGSHPKRAQHFIEN